MTCVLGRLDEGIDILELLAARDPLNSSIPFQLGQSYYLEGRFDKAVEWHRYQLTLAPQTLGGYYGLAVSLLLQGNASAALAESQKEPNEPFRLNALALAYHATGRGVESDAALAEMIEKYEKISTYNIASILAFRGEADRAFEWLDKAVEYRDGGLQMIEEPLFDKIHDDPRWLPFLRRIGRAPEQLAAIELDVTLPE
ncbi:MAG: hypothetical protein K8J08_14435 [Thermoanaerobaculia bacterium]|nr:hypothetical protein [Thermoanaerobaculia bacterium]